MRFRPIRQGLRRNVGRRHRIDVWWRLVDDLRHSGWPRHVRRLWLFNHEPDGCNGLAVLLSHFRPLCGSDRESCARWWTA